MRGRCSWLYQHHTRFQKTILDLSFQIWKKENYSHSADWFSFGVTLFRLVYGRDPFLYATDEMFVIRDWTVQWPDRSVHTGYDTLNLLKGLLEVEEWDRFDENEIIEHKYFNVSVEAPPDTLRDYFFSVRAASAGIACFLVCITFKFFLHHLLQPIL